MVSDILLWLLVAVTLVQPTRERVYTAALFAGPAGLHGIFLGDMDGIAYYGSAAAVDLAVLWAIAHLETQSRITISIQRICLASIVLNAVGWVLWAMYLSPVAYNTAFVVLYSATLVILLQKDRADVGSNSVDREHPDLQLDTTDRCAHLHGHGGKI